MNSDAVLVELLGVGVHVPEPELYLYLNPHAQNLHNLILTPPCLSTGLDAVVNIPPYTHTMRIAYLPKPYALRLTVAHRYFSTFIGST